MTGQDKDREELRRRLEAVKERIASAAERAGRGPEEVGLIVVTKKHPSRKIAALFSLGHVAVGENRVQEALQKIETLGGEGQWHLIGHLQRNKARQIAGKVAMIHSVDSVRLIEELEKRCAAQNNIQSILLEINVAGEANKTGAPPEDLPALLDALAATPHLRAEGLMTMAPYAPDPESARPHFARLREILTSIPSLPHFTPRHLSMGMSGDYEVAIAEGATLVRIGTAIMGSRPNGRTEI